MIRNPDILEVSRATLAKKTATSVIFMLLTALLLIHTVVQAEDVRKIKSKTNPEYPQLAKRLNIRGVARVRVTIAPDGAVREVKEIGGNPVLVDALARAVRTWKYEPADKTSVVEVKFDFQP
jgi:TonB family protein